MGAFTAHIQTFYVHFLVPENFDCSLFMENLILLRYKRIAFISTVYYSIMEWF